MNNLKLPVKIWKIPRYLFVAWQTLIRFPWINSDWIGVELTLPTHDYPVVVLQRLYPWEHFGLVPAEVVHQVSGFDGITARAVDGFDSFHRLDRVRMHSVKGVEEGVLH